jgi:16S rRNA (cytosine967-C5)-methyltransferase
VYSTCTLLAEENDVVVDAFLDSRRDFEIDPTPAPACTAALVGPDGRFRTMPHRDQMPGFFGARLRRK